MTPQGQRTPWHQVFHRSNVMATRRFHGLLGRMARASQFPNGEGSGSNHSNAAKTGPNAIFALLDWLANRRGPNISISERR